MKREESGGEGRGGERRKKGRKEKIREWREGGGDIYGYSRVETLLCSNLYSK